MKRGMSLTVIAITCSVPVLASAASVELKNVYANVEVIPEDRSDVVVEVRAADRKLPPARVTRSGGDVLVDGGLSPMNSCSGIRPGHAVVIPGFGWMSPASALNITVHTPRDARITASGAVLGTVRPAQDLDLRASGCSQWRIADVSGTLSVRQAGASSITAGSAGKADFDLSGLTHVDMASARSLTVDMSGMGKVLLKSISGPVGANLSGMGSVDIAGGHAGKVKADISGMGGLTLHGAAAELDAEVSGVGGVHVDHVDGAVHKSVSGIGHVSVGR